MSRVIKFRAWAGEEYIEAKDLCHVDGEASKQADRLGYVYEMFTGLTDKNGAEIYEGDIISNASYEPPLVNTVAYNTFEEGSGHIVAGFFLWYSESVVEVIGNIHEHRHLLTS